MTIKINIQVEVDNLFEIGQIVFVIDGDEILEGEILDIIIETQYEEYRLCKQPITFSYDTNPCYQIKIGILRPEFHESMIFKTFEEAQDRLNYLNE